MIKDAEAPADLSAGVATPRILVVAGGPAANPLRDAASPPPDGWTFAHGLEDAAAMAGTRRFDALVVDAATALENPGLVAALRHRVGGPALLIHPDHRPIEAARAAEALGGEAALVPPELPSELQIEWILQAAERAHFAREAERRTASLHELNRELERVRAHFRDVIEHNADALVVIGADGSIRFANRVAAELFRTHGSELVGRPFGFPLVAGETTEVDLPRGDAPIVAEMRVVHSEWEGQPAFIASLRDITARRKAEADARRLIEERAARAAAEAAAQRLRFVAEATTLLTLPLDFRETLSTLARLCVQQLADWAVIYLVEEAGQVRRLEVAHRDSTRAALLEELRADPIESAGPLPVLDVIRRRAPRVANRLREDEVAAIAQDARHLELLRGLGTASYLIVPMIARDRVIGAIALVTADPETSFADEDVTLASDLALRAALAVDNARLLAQANEANVAKSNLLAIISHDLRTPLNSIMGHTELLALGIPEPLSEGTLHRVDRIRTSASHLVYLIDELLAFARLDSGAEEIHLSDVDARELVAEVAAVVEPLALERGLRFETSLPAAELPIRTDTNRLRQILLNLTGNAIKYTREGEVRLTLEETTVGVEYQVRDTGVGIAPEHLDKIFDPFWQVDPAQRSAEGGTGLGLSVVQGLVRLLDGEVTVRSELGCGSTFVVRLPRRPTG